MPQKCLAGPLPLPIGVYVQGVYRRGHGGGGGGGLVFGIIDHL